MHLNEDGPCEKFFAVCCVTEKWFPNAMTAPAKLSLTARSKEAWTKLDTKSAELNKNLERSQ